MSIEFNPSSKEPIGFTADGKKVETKSLADVAAEGKVIDVKNIDLAEIAEQEKAAAKNTDADPQTGNIEQMQTTTDGIVENLEQAREKDSVLSMDYISAADSQLKTIDKNINAKGITKDEKKQIEKMQKQLKKNKEEALKRHGLKENDSTSYQSKNFGDAQEVGLQGKNFQKLGEEKTRAVLDKMGINTNEHIFQNGAFKSWNGTNYLSITIDNTDAKKPKTQLIHTMTTQAEDGSNTFTSKSYDVNKKMMKDIEIGEGDMYTQPEPSEGYLGDTPVPTKGQQLPKGADMEDVNKKAAEKNAPVTFSEDEKNQISSWVERQNLEHLTDNDVNNFADFVMKYDKNISREAAEEAQKQLQQAYDNRQTKQDYNFNQEISFEKEAPKTIEEIQNEVFPKPELKPDTE